MDYKRITRFISIIAIAGFLPVMVQAKPLEDQISELKDQVELQDKEISKISKKLDKQIAAGSGPKSTLKKFSVAVKERKKVAAELKKLESKSRTISSSTLIEY